MALTRIRELQAGSKKMERTILSYREHHRVGFRLAGTQKAGRANEIINQDVNLFHSFSRRLRIFGQRRPHTKKNQILPSKKAFMLLNKFHDRYTAIYSFSRNQENLDMNLRHILQLNAASCSSTMSERG